MFQTSSTNNQNSLFVFSNFFENRDICEVIWKDIVERGRSQMTIWLVRNACWIPKATDTHSVCVILIVFPFQQWLHESASIVRFTYIDWLVS